MQANFVVRLIDLTLLLLLSLLAVVKINEYEVDLPVSHDLTDPGSILAPLKAAISMDGDVYVEGAGIVSPEQLAEISSDLQRSVELRVDAQAEATYLMEVHQILESASRPAVFVVEHQSRR